MICLHGLGDTCNNYRNALINGLGWGASMPNTIFICPEAATASSDFYYPAGGELIIQKSIELAMSRYHIDTANIVLQGFSLGGRAALRYGLDNYKIFKGLLLNTPAIQGVKEALNGHAAAYAFNYKLAGKLPIYITHGATDFTYESSIDSTYEQLVLNDAMVRYVDVAGLGHSIPSTAQMGDFTAFFNNPAHAGKDIEVVRLYPTPLLNCTAPVSAGLLFRNNGEDTIKTVKFRYTLGSTVQTATWSGALPSYQHAIINTGFSTPASGDNLLSVEVDTINNLIPDSVAANNHAETTLHFAASPLPVLHEGFEGATFPPAGWVLQEAGDFYTAWDQDNTVARTGSQSAGTFNTIFFFDNAGRSEGLITPLIAVGSTKPGLSFDVAYNYHRYTPPYFTASTDFADTLEVLISTDCGAHYTSLYKKGGADLATFSSPILNPLSIQADFIQPADSNWIHEHIDLSSFTAGGNVVNAVFKFNYTSALGGSINIDNVFVGSVTGIASAARPVYRIYPNPTRDYITVEGAANATVTICNSLGQQVRHEQISNASQNISLSGLPAGAYLVTVTGAEGGRFATRLMKGD
jgi:pimeloyl-ACP methyl ester carboxylesterase